MRCPAAALLTLLALVAATATADTAVGRVAPATIGERVLELVNHGRAQGRRCGRTRYAPSAPLAPSPLLERAAQRHAADMARNRYFEHTARDGSEPRDRVARTGYRSRLTGENIAYGPTTAEEVVAGWLASVGHCENIMEPRFEEMGIAWATDRRSGAIYWVQVLASARPRG
jgi:uncharacterized protein YkwD